MSLSQGDRIGPYEILKRVGTGGMGEVYGARDSRLGRTVAIKVSKEEFSDRFEREAKVVATLNHPNICTIHDVGRNYLVMEFVEGVTLAERIAAGAIPVHEALDIARQIAEALEAAHNKAVIHRDLKPANVMLTPEGKVKVLDFGLAKALDADCAASDPATSPTLTISSTRAGMILGSAAYMSPEQARGTPVDKRADIWAFGVVLFEMMTGSRAFCGETVSDTLAAVLRADIEWHRLPAETPAAVRRLLRRLLARDRKERLHDIADARLEIEEAGRESEIIPAANPRHRNYFLIAVTAFASVVAVLGATAWWKTPRETQARLMRLNVDLGAEADLKAYGGTRAILSPDGRQLIYTAKNKDGQAILFRRALDEAKGTPLAGTEGASSPFFSADGRSVGFFALGKLRTALTQGGGAVTVCDAAAGRGGTWTEDDSEIIAALTTFGGLSVIAAGGGIPRPLTKLEPGEHSHRWPQMLPGGKGLLFTSTRSAGNYEDAQVEVLSLSTGGRKVLARGAFFGRYVASGHLLYVHQGRVFADRFDISRFEVAGKPVQILSDVDNTPTSGYGQFDASAGGTMVYVPGATTEFGWSLAWLEKSGAVRAIPLSPGIYRNPRVSPNGKHIALTVVQTTRNIWIYDTEADSMRRLTYSSGGSLSPVWSPDGQGVAYGADGGMYWIRSDGGGEAKRLTESANPQTPWSFSPDGKRLAFVEESPTNGADIWVLPIDWSDHSDPKPAKPEPFLHSGYMESDPAFSPDGRWLAYTSDEAGLNELYVRPFPGPGGKSQLSSGGARFPVWSDGGRELLYQSFDGHIMAVAITSKGDSLATGRPQLWNETRLDDIGLLPRIDAGGWQRQRGSRSKESILALIARGITAEQKPSTQVVFLVNFFDELRRIVR
jgi:Tol biopolymer transport system component/predicted Ser/Thr protein kinase